MTNLCKYIKMSVMSKKSKATELVLLTLIFISLLTRDTRAYLDPGSSSYLLQILLAGFFSVLLAIKTFWKKITLLMQQVFGFKEKASKNEKAKAE